MSGNKHIVVFLAMLCFCCISCKAQPAFGTNNLTLQKDVPMPDVKGRIDHMDVNLQNGIVYVAALGNNSVEAVDIHTGQLIHSIKGLHEPQGIGYIPQTHEIFVANGGNGDCCFYNTGTFEKTATIHLSSDADDVRYDSASETIYVGYGEGGIAVIDARNHKQTGDVPLPAHPEGFQIDKSLHTMLVNVPDKNMIAVIDLKQLKITDKWTSTSPTANFPMALDTIHHYAFIGYRHPARLVVMDTKTGKQLSTNEMVHDVDDLYFDHQNQRIYISGGGGYINIFELQTGGQVKQIANIPTKNGARTSLLIPSLKVFVLAERASSNSTAQLSIFTISH